MSPLSSRPQPGERGWQVFNMTALVLALVALASLVIVLLSKWAGAAPWTGFNWIAMLALPAAFVMMGGSVLRSVARRRQM